MLCFRLCGNSFSLEFVWINGSRLDDKSGIPEVDSCAAQMGLPQRLFNNPLSAVTFKALRTIVD